MESSPSNSAALNAEIDVGKAAADFLASASERRKRARASMGPMGEHARKRHVSSHPAKVNVEAARKSALALARESSSYKKLMEMEERLDLAIMRKQQDIKETLKSQFFSEKRIFRLYIFNTYRSQPDTPGVTSEDVASWSLRIQGHLLQRSEQSNPVQNGNASESDIRVAGVPGLSTISGATRAASSTQIPGVSGSHQAAESASVLVGPPPKCSDVFSRVIVELDKQLYPENNMIEWKRKDGEPSSNGFEISRAGSKEFTAKIYLYVDHRPEQFRVSWPLSRLIGVKRETKKNIFVGVWQYVKKNRLQCVDDRTTVRLNPGLKTLLGPVNQNVQTLKLQQLFAIIKSHLGPTEPIQIDYDVKLNGDVVDNQDCYDIEVNVQDTSLIESARKAGVFGLGLPQSTEYEALSEKHMVALQKIAEHKKRRDFFEGFCSNPVQFINHLILSQTRDLKVLGGSTGRNPEEERRASFYQQQWVYEAVPRYLLRKAIADTAEETVESMLKS
ncbi:SWI/SNF complex component SNF12-like [Gracilariopsis chorda]|uniref:SWI/SNF complex component SNF12-like n=1 Tax=Gracilariopsis chorda TaxID=448386 RepID=A0A2V3IEL4_9FLOR|nr:SWI/SNF complex component SNF12-like [Gracilariopsis chorda]|eukprot:PXF40492.1 SWI/SNF complex component SNF12-like [Gracilariopsis chorda]